jgi:hypothetical protein
MTAYVCSANVTLGRAQLDFDDAPTLVMDSTLVIDRALLGVANDARDRAAMREKMAPLGAAPLSEETPLPLSPDVTQPSRLRLRKARHTRHAAAIAMAVAFVAGIAAAVTVELATSPRRAAPVVMARIPRSAATDKRSFEVQGSASELSPSAGPSTTASTRGASGRKRVRATEPAGAPDSAADDRPRDVDPQGLLDDGLGRTE